MTGVAQTDCLEGGLLENDCGTWRLGAKDLRGRVNIFGWLIENEFRIGDVCIDELEWAAAIVQAAVI